jgi:hypothetical protein
MCLLKYFSAANCLLVDGCLNNFIHTHVFNLSYSFRLRWGGEDKLCWVPSKRGLFNVRSYNNVLVPHEHSFPLERLFGRIRLP